MSSTRGLCGSRIGGRSPIDASSPELADTPIRPRFAELLAEQAWLPDGFRASARESGMGGVIGQWLLFPAAHRSLSLFSLVVPSGSEMLVHDHLAWRLVGLYQGRAGASLPAHAT